MVSFIYSQLLAAKRHSVHRVLEVVLPHLTKIWDPEVRTRVRKSTLAMPLSHRLPLNVALHPHYDTLLPRLGGMLYARRGSFTMIDVGANIGDTARLTADEVPAAILCVEPEPQFFHLLEKNTRSYPEIARVNTALGDGGASAEAVKLNRDISGSAIIESGNGVSLDTVLLQYPTFANADVLKIDTDGYDFTVIRGASGLLTQARPLIFFEHSPEHCVKVAKEDPLAVFAYLKTKNYVYHMIYDSQGHLIGLFHYDHIEAIEQLLFYARATGKFYDILSFPLEQAAFADAFFRSERAYFPFYNRPYLSRFALSPHSAAAELQREPLSPVKFHPNDDSTPR